LTTPRQNCRIGTKHLPTENPPIMPKGDQTFGEFIRSERMAKEIGLREMARKIGASPSYLSKIERGEFPPPSENLITTIAKLLERDLDEIMARANRVPSELTDILRKRPAEMGRLLRSADKQDSQALNQVANKLEKGD